MRIGIVGVGNVGSTLAYTLLLEGLTSKITLVDRNLEKARGEALDLNHGLCYVHYTKIETGGYESLSDSDVIIVTAGLARKPGESRVDLAAKNVKLFREVIPEITAVNKKAILFVVSNPVDVLTYAALKFSGFSRRKVFGLGNVLDSARLRYILGNYFGVDPGNVHSYLLGEHGDSGFALLSSAFIGCTRIMDLPGYDDEKIRKSVEEVKQSPAEIIKTKGYTSYAVSLSIAKVLDSIHRDKSRVQPISVYLDDYYGVSDVCMSVPSLVDASGVKEVLKVRMSEEEAELFRKSGDALKQILRQNGLHRPL